MEIDRRFGEDQRWGAGDVLRAVLSGVRACIVRCWDRHEQSGGDDRMPESKPRSQHEQNVRCDIPGDAHSIAQEQFPLWADAGMSRASCPCKGSGKERSRYGVKGEHVRRRIPKL